MGEVFCIDIELLLGKPIPHTEVPGFEPWLCLLPLHIQATSRWWLIHLVPGHLGISRTRRNSWVLAVAWPGCCRHLLFETTHGQFISPSLPHPISLFQIKIINILKFILKWNVSLDDLNGHAKAILPLAINVCLSMAAMRQLCPIDNTEIGSGTVWPH